MSKFLFLTTFLSAFAAFMFGVPNANGAVTEAIDFNNIDVEDSLLAFEACETNMLPVNFDGEYLGFHAAGLINDARQALKDCDIRQVDLHIINDEGRKAENAYKTTLESFFRDHGLDVMIKVQSVKAVGADELKGQGIVNIHVTGTDKTV